MKLMRRSGIAVQRVVPSTQGRLYSTASNKIVPGAPVLFKLTGSELHFCRVDFAGCAHR